MAALAVEETSEKKHLSLVVCGHVDAGKINNYRTFDI